ncbi:hypothetical protein DAPPUDRAFT_256520 [Daphnia pulex]|uniref:Uncharacterized protein n=1 Tax=Daphnia pulex TaxID=6669 RepID=E9HBJ6_DAPPU|nr:hypothetical protein DAPPUDRAFT_256520 [Daphnia pulex]|eukprot:EFX70904.1 hypothetical protein DAPPUDRAFT_256520 [Daphnia pulex]
MRNSNSADNHIGIFDEVGQPSFLLRTALAAQKTHQEALQITGYHFREKAQAAQTRPLVNASGLVNQVHSSAFWTGLRESSDPHPIDLTSTNLTRKHREHRRTSLNDISSCPSRVVLVSVILGSFSSDLREQRINWVTLDVFGSVSKEKEDCSFHSTVRSRKSEVKDEVITTPATTPGYYTQLPHPATTPSYYTRLLHPATTAMASTTKACGNPACPVTFTSVGNRKNGCYPSVTNRAKRPGQSLSSTTAAVNARLPPNYVESPTRSPTGSSRDRSWAPSPSTITTRALSPVTSARLTRPSTASPGTSSTPTRSARRNHSSRPSRRPPDRDPGMSICITDGSIQLAHPLPAKIFCSTCGTSRRWSGRNCISDAIRHFRTFHATAATSPRPFRLPSFIRKKRVLDRPHPINLTQLALLAKLNFWATKSSYSTLLDPASALCVAGPVLELVQMRTAPLRPVWRMV